MSKNYPFPVKVAVFSKAMRQAVKDMLKTWRKLWVVLLILVVLFSGTRFVTNTIYQASSQQTEVAATSPQATQENQNEETSAPPVVSTILAFLLLSAILIAVFIWAVADAKRPHKGKTGDEAKTPITEILQQPVIAALGGVIVINVLASLFAYPAWKWYFDHHVLFFGTNMGLPIFVHFVKRQDTVSKGIAAGIMILIVAGFFFVNYDSNNEQVPTSNITVTPGFSPQLGRGQMGDVSYALAVFSGCETGNGTPGSGRQFLEGQLDEQGRPIPVRNPQDGAPGTGAVGKWQINLSDQNVREELKLLEAEMKADGRLDSDESLDVEWNEDHNRAAAEHLYNKYGTAPWTASVDCWMDKVTVPGGLNINIEAVAVEEWSDTPYIPFPDGFMLNWGKTEGVFEGRTDKGEIVKYDRANGILENFSQPSSKIKFRSLEKEGKPVIIKIILTPQHMSVLLPIGEGRSFFRSYSNLYRTEKDV